MIVTCPSCSARYKLDDSKITGRGARITCPRCRHVFVVFPSGSAKAEKAEEDTSRNEAVASGRSAAAAGGGPSLKVVTAPSGSAPKPRRSAEDLDFRTVGIPSWKVKVKIGLVYDFSDIKTLRKYIQDGRVTPEDAISHDGSTWKTIGDILDLDAYFVEIYEAAESQRAAANPDNAFADESPTTIVGMGSLGRNLASEALRQATEEALSDSSQPGMGAGFNSGASPAPTGGGTTGGGEGNPFVDPFAALKDRQRERIQSRRSGGAAEAKKAKDAQASQSRFLLVALVLVGLGGVWWLMGQQSGPAAGSIQPAAPVTNKLDTEQIAKQARDDLERQMRETLKEIEPEEPVEPPEPELIPIRPDDPTQRRAVPPSTATNPAPTPPVQQAAPAATLATASDHVDTAWDAIRRNDWNTAFQACRAAKGLEARNPKVMMACGAAQFHKGQIDAASQDLSGAEAAGSRDARLKKYQCLVAENQGDYAGAVGFCRTYLATNPSDAARIQALIDDMTGG